MLPSTRLRFRQSSKGWEPPYKLQWLTDCLAFRRGAARWAKSWTMNAPLWSRSRTPENSPPRCSDYLMTKICRGVWAIPAGAKWKNVFQRTAWCKIRLAFTRTFCANGEKHDSVGAHGDSASGLEAAAVARITSERSCARRAVRRPGGLDAGAD